MTSDVTDPRTSTGQRDKDVGRNDWLGHPRPLARLFVVEMWERMGFYGMRALLTLYLTKHFLLSDHAAAGLYGGYTALVYLTPLAGGWAADRILGARRAVQAGALLMAAGYFAMAFGGSPARPWIEWDGTRHEISMSAEHGPASAKPNRRTVLENGKVVTLVQAEDRSLQLRDHFGRTVRSIPEGKFAFGSTPDRARLWLLLFALSLVAMGNGLFKPNVSTMVGALYAAGDKRRDAGFTIFYMGINLGSMLGQFLCPLLADVYGWGVGFAFAGCGMFVAWALMSFRTQAMRTVGRAPEDAIRWVGMPVVILVALALVPPCAIALSGMLEPAAPQGEGVLSYLARLPAMGKVMLGTFAAAVPAILIWAKANGSAAEFRMMVAAMWLISFNSVFWSLFEQAGSSLTLFADRNTDRSVFGLFTLSAPQTQNFNSLSIVLLAPVVSVLWGWLGRRGREPSVPVKFALALAGAGAGFLLLVLGCQSAGADGRVGLQWLAGLYVLHSLAELLISPVGLSMITGMAMARVTGLMMGTWFLSLAMGEYVAGMLAQMASAASAGESLDPRHSLMIYSHAFARIGWTALALSAALLFLAAPLGKLMRGERAWGARTAQ